jgi:hypothetical protein
MSRYPLPTAEKERSRPFYSLTLPITLIHGGNLHLIDFVYLAHLSRHSLEFVLSLLGLLRQNFKRFFSNATFLFSGDVGHHRSHRSSSYILCSTVTHFSKYLPLVVVAIMDGLNHLHGMPNAKKSKRFDAQRIKHVR